MDFTNMDMEALEARKAAIATECEAEGADVDALLDEVRAINAEIEARKAKAEKEAEIRKAVASGAGAVIEEAKVEERNMNLEEIRKSKEYNAAYAEFLKTGDDSECRALLTTNAASGTVPVPTYVEDRIRTAWERNGISRRVARAYFRGNLQIGFESSATGASTHTEGADGPNEETLIIGTVTLVAKHRKKWISVSDEVLSLKGEAFLDYLYDEIVYQIAKKTSEDLLDDIIACGTVSTDTQVAVPVIVATTAAVGTVALALGELSDEAENIDLIMNKKTWAALKNAQSANKFNYDPFEGYNVIFSNHLKSIDAATTGETYLIAGDLGTGALFNFPDGEEFKFTFDDVTLATSDLVKITGKEFVGIGVVKPYAFVKVTK